MITVLADIGTACIGPLALAPAVVHFGGTGVNPAQEIIIVLGSVQGTTCC